MSTLSDQFGAKPAVLRCGRCGKFVDWEDAHVQVVCTCRPHIDLPPVLVREATESDRAAARVLFQQDFGGSRRSSKREPRNENLEASSSEIRASSE